MRSVVGVPRSLLLRKSAAVRFTGLDVRDFDDLVAAGILPAGIVLPSGNVMWHREALEAGIDRLAGHTSEILAEQDMERRREHWQRHYRTRSIRSEERTKFLESLRPRKPKK